MKKFNLKLQPNLRPKSNFGWIGKKMFWEFEEKPTVEGISNDYTENVHGYIDAGAGRHFHEEENSLNRKRWRIG